MRCRRSAERPTSSGFGEVGSEAAVRMRVTQGRAARGRRRKSRRMETPLQIGTCGIGTWEVYTGLEHDAAGSVARAIKPGRLRAYFNSVMTALPVPLIR